MKHKKIDGGGVLAESVYGFTAGWKLNPDALKRDISGYSFDHWEGLCDEMPANDLTIYAYYQAVE